MSIIKFKNNISILQLLCMLAVILCISGCSPFGLFGKDDEEKDPEIAADETAAKLYKEANRSLQKGDVTGAVDSYSLLESRYPFGKYAQQGQLELSYAYYKQSKYDQALSTINRFIKLNPQHANLDYAYYLKGLIAYDSGKSIVHWVLPRDPSNNDPTSIIEAFEVFGLLIEKFPESEYADDAKLRMIYLRNELAEYEIKVAKYYMKRGAYVASANRAKYVIENYQGAEVMPEALFILQQSYLELGINELAEDTGRVYAQNFQTGKDGTISEDFTRDVRSCAEGLWNKMLEKLRLRTYYCN